MRQPCTPGSITGVHPDVQITYTPMYRLCAPGCTWVLFTIKINARTCLFCLFITYVFKNVIVINSCKKVGDTW